MKDRSHDESMVLHFQKNPAYAAELLMEVQREGDSEELAILLRQMAATFQHHSIWNVNATFVDVKLQSE